MHAKHSFSIGLQCQPLFQCAANYDIVQKSMAVVDTHFQQNSIDYMLEPYWGIHQLPNHSMECEQAILRNQTQVFLAPLLNWQMQAGTL